MEPRSTVAAVAGKGIAGDAAFGTSRRQVLLIDAETLAGFELTPGMVRENITLTGLPLQGLPRGSQLHIDNVVLEITGDCTPCDYLDRLRPGLRQALVGRRGVLARVAHGGELKVGAPVRLQVASGVSTASTS
jgi:MOSC domain-containing protein YiiM